MSYLRKRSLFSTELKKQKRRYNYEEDRDSIWFAGHLLKLQREGKIEVYSHIPHETYTNSWNQKKKNKMKGVRAGVPDYIIVIKGFVVFIELKRKHGGSVSKEQKEWLNALEGKTTMATVAHGFDEAKEIIDKILTRA